MGPSRKLRKTRWADVAGAVFVAIPLVILLLLLIWVLFFYLHGAE